MCRTDTWWAVYREILQTGHVEMVQTVEELVWGAHDKLIFGRIWVASQLRQTLKVIRNGWKAHTCFCLSRLKNCHTKWVKWYRWVSLIFVIQSSTLSHVNTGTLQNSVEPLPTPVPATSAQPTWPSSNPLLPKQMPLGPFSGQRKYLRKGFKQVLEAATVVLRD